MCRQYILELILYGQGPHVHQTAESVHAHDWTWWWRYERGQIPWVAVRSGYGFSNSSLDRAGGF